MQVQEKVSANSKLSARAPVAPAATTSLPDIVPTHATTLVQVDPPATSGLDLRVLTPVWTTVFAAMLWMTSTRPFVRRLADDLGTSVSMIGQFTTAAMLAIAVAGLFSGPIADHIGHRRSIVTGLVLIATSALTMGASLNVAMLLGAGIIGGVGFSMTYGVALGSVTTHFAGDARKRALGISHGFANSATIVSAPVLTTIAALALWRGSFTLIAVVAVIAATVAARMLPTAKSPSSEPVRPVLVLRAYRPLLTAPSVLMLYAASMLRGIIGVGVPAYLGAFYVDRYGLSLGEVGIASTFEGCGLVLGSVAAGTVLRGLNPRALFAAAAAGIGLCWAAIFALEPPLHATIGTAATLLFLAGVTMSTISILLAQETPCGSATTMVLNISVTGFGAAIGAFLGGLLIDVGGYALLGIAVIPVALTAALLVWRPRSHTAALSAQQGVPSVARPE